MIRLVLSPTDAGKKKKLGIVRFPPLGGCREGFHRGTYLFEIADKPLPATTHFHHTPPKGGNKKIFRTRKATTPTTAGINEKKLK
ncbi:hypothetical protein DIU36_28920 [Mucilaginibacter rubeus]|nr:hypothetical protein DIU36_28920 [Mucilaginibacter rubeus]